MRRIVVIALSVMLALVVAMPMVSGKPTTTKQKPTPPGQLKQNLGLLGAEWWIWALEEPTPTNPLLGDYPDGPQCDGLFTNKAGGVFFLAGTVFAEDVPATRECTVPHKTRLFFPIMNTFWAEPPDAFTEQEYREYVNMCIDEALVGSTMFVTVDGEPVPISIQKQRADTPFFSFDLPPDNIFGDPRLAGVYEGVADGVWVLLPRLSKGEHIITFGGDFPNNPPGNSPSGPPPLGCGGAFSQNNTYTLTVE